MTNYSWRVSWFWPQLNHCAWIPPYLWHAQPTACSTTSRKWTLAPWNGTWVRPLTDLQGSESALFESTCRVDRKQARSWMCLCWAGNDSATVKGKDQWMKCKPLKVGTSRGCFCITGVSRGTRELRWTGSRSCPICPCHHSYDSMTTCRGGKRGNQLLS